MEFEDALTLWVAQQAAIADLIQETNRIRFFKVKVPQGSRMPSSVVQRGGAGRQYGYCRKDGAVRMTMQLDHYAKNWQDMAKLGTTFRKTLDDSQFPLWMGSGDSPQVAIKVKSASCDNEFDLDEPSTGLLRRTQTWSFWVYEP